MTTGNQSTSAIVEDETSCCQVCTDSALVKLYWFYCQIGHKYDRAQIWDGIVYHFSHFRKLWMLESDYFNHKMTSSQAKPVQCCPAMVGFSYDKINIL